MANSGPPTWRQSFQTCRAELQHEYNVLSSRLTAYIMSQAFLVSAFAVAMNNTGYPWSARYRLFFPLLLAAIGVALSVRAHPGIKGVCQIISRWHVRQKELLDAAGEDLEDWTVLRQPTVASANERNLWFAQTSAWLFGIAWTLMGIIVVWVSLQPQSRRLQSHAQQTGERFARFVPAKVERFRAARSSNKRVGSCPEDL